MKRILTALFLLVWASAFCLVYDQRPVRAAGDDEIYTASVPPLVMLVMGRNHKLYYEAYNDASDLDGDGQLDVGYNPSIDYYGYFDSFKVYKYDGTNQRFYPVRYTTNKQTSGNPADGEWSGDFLNYLTMSRMDTLRKVLYGGYRSTDTATETVLQRVYVPQDAHSWGKEYESIARDGYDIRDYAPLALPAAGTRHLFASTTLSDNGTPLLRVLPNNIHRIWEWVAKERPVCDGSLVSGAGSHPGHPGDHAEYENLALTYAVSANQLGSAAPGNGRIDGAGNPFGAQQDNYLTIFTGSINITTGGDYQFAVDGDDAVEVIIDGTVVAGWYGGHGNCGCYSHAGTITLSAGTHSLEFRQEEASGADNYYLRWNGRDSGNNWEITPSSAFTDLTQTVYSLVSPGSTITDYAVRVKVGVDGLQEANCKKYPNGTWKPTGILQKYGESGKMYFGLLTGSYAKNTSGGVLRKPIGPITDEIDPNTGQFTATNGIINTINKFRILEYRYSDYSYIPGWSGAWVTTRPMNEGEFPDWGNPIGEMMYEALRYFAGKGTPTTDYHASTMAEDDSMGLPNATWDDPYVTNSYCAKPFMLVLTDINPTYDSDQLPGSYFGAAPTPNDMTGMNVDNLADTILTEEGESGAHYVGQVGSTYNGSCSPKNMTGFGDVRGLCPEEPTKQGSYYSASVAYYGRTHDINPAPSEQNVLSYIVGLASPLPRINIPVGNQHITLVPFAKSVGGCLGINGTEGDFQPTNTIVDFFVDTITPTYGKFRINYEDVEQAADHDMDAIVIYEYQLVDSGGSPVSDPADGTNVRITLTSEYASGCIIQHCGYIISGTTTDGTYLEVKDYDTGAGSDVDYFLDTPPGQGPGETWNDGSDLPLSTTRTFAPGTGSAATLLKTPLWYAAKWGGFNDFNDNNQPDLDAEWDEDADGIPDTYYYVVNPLRLEEQLNQSFADILSRGVSHVAPVVSVDEANRTQSGDEIYMAFFKPMDEDYWRGNLKKYGLAYLPRTDCGRSDPEWTVVDQSDHIAEDSATCDGHFDPQSDSYWSTNDGGYVDRGGVGGVLKDAIDGVTIGGTDTYDFRKIYTYLGGSLTEFHRNNISNADLGVSTDVERYRLINFMYGYTNDTDGSGNPVEKRDWILGDIIHSEPKVMDYLDADGSLQYRYIAVGSNDGMLHVFMVYPDTATFYVNKDFTSGQEVFAFIPSDLLPKIQDLANPATRTHMVDGSVNLFKATSKTGDYYDKTLVFGERRGGRSYWALDVTDPDPSEWTVKWHIEGGTGDYTEMGYSWSKPYFAKIKTSADPSDDKEVVILSGGYDPLEDAFPEPFLDDNSDGIHQSGESYTDTAGGTSGSYDKYNPGKDTMGRGIFVVDLSDGSLLFKAPAVLQDEVLFSRGHLGHPFLGEQNRHVRS